MSQSRMLRGCLICLAFLCLPASTLFADITWNISYDDVTNGNGIGFDDAARGATRRATVTAVTGYLNSVLDHNGTVDFEFRASQLDGQGFLASAGTYFSIGTPKFQNGAFFTHATTGNDPFGGVPDGFATVDFGYNWNDDTGSVGGNEYDLYSVILHEITHSMGFLSLVTPDGRSTIDGGNPGQFSNFDSFLERGDGTKLFSTAGGASFEGTPADLVSGDIYFNGANARARNNGERIKIYAPTVFDEGSSISHVDTTAGDWVMRHAISQGKERRTYSNGEIGILQDLGWQTVPEPGQVVALSLIAITLLGGGYVRRRRRRELPRV